CSVIKADREFAPDHGSPEILINPTPDTYTCKTIINILRRRQPKWPCLVSSINIREMILNCYCNVPGRRVGGKPPVSRSMSIRGSLRPSVPVRLQREALVKRASPSSAGTALEPAGRRLN